MFDDNRQLAANQTAAFPVTMVTLSDLELGVWRFPPSENPDSPPASSCSAPSSAGRQSGKQSSPGADDDDNNNISTPRFFSFNRRRRSRTLGTNLLFIDTFRFDKFKRAFIFQSVMIIWKCLSRYYFVFSNLLKKALKYEDNPLLTCHCTNVSLKFTL